jgi:hypothetical protein
MGSPACDSGFIPETIAMQKTMKSIGLSGVTGICHSAMDCSGLLRTYGHVAGVGCFLKFRYSLFVPGR